MTTVECSCRQCGHRYRVASRHAGQSLSCPRCHGVIEVFANPAIVVVDEPLSSSPRRSVPDDARRPFYRDRVLVVGAAIPSFILIVFGIYIYWEHHVKALSERIATVKGQADAAAVKGEVERAYEAYQSLIEEVGSSVPSDERSRDNMKSVKDAAAKLAPQVAQIRVERERLMSAKRKAEEEYAEFRRQEAEHAREAARLAAITASVRGTAWVELEGGAALRLKGVDVYLIPEKIRKRQVEDVLSILSKEARILMEATDEARSKRKATAAVAASFAVLSGKVDMIASGDPDDHIDLAGLNSVIRRVTLGDGNGAFISNDKYWPAVLAAAKATRVYADIEGRFEFRGVRGGFYYLAAIHEHRGSVIEWVLPVTVDGDVSVDLHSRVAARLVESK